MRYLIVHDVSEDDVRSHVARVLEAFGPRVQESVFEAELAGADLPLLARRLTGVLQPAEVGNIRICRLCYECLAASFGLGLVAPGLGSEACIVI